MSERDEGRQWIDRHVTVPVVSYDWAASPADILRGRDTAGMIEEWKKVRDLIRRRRSPLSTGSLMWKACEEALALVDYITKAGTCGAVTGDWRPGHQILSDIAAIYERVTGRIDPMVQAIVRDAMDEAFTSERFGQ